MTAEYGNNAGQTDVASGSVNGNAGGVKRLLTRDRVRPVVFGGLSLVIALVTWQLLSTFVFNPLLVPPPLEVVRAAIPMITSGEIFRDVAISMSRVLIGYVSGSIAAIILGVLL